jgi:hypothetical protein
VHVSTAVNGEAGGNGGVCHGGGVGVQSAPTCSCR